MADKTSLQPKLMRLALGLLCLFFVHSSIAQEEDFNASLTDSIGNEAPTNVKNPKKAIYLALMFPGAGQVYNEKVWKLPLLYSGVSAAVYFLNFNNRRYKEFIVALDIVREGTEANPFPNLNEDGIIRNVEYWRRNRDAMYMVFGAIYALGAVDAFVDAHLSGFDVSDDLTFKLEPSMEPLLANNSAIGLSFKIKF
ncbi:DUF5683 domain-containing protein [Cyclobacterium amurskyense]|uniref:DUF5683 domain-containing protein n=1 Tax=Cyclobacterium amurskyense TaxID=320787 RepID=A0A0H4PGM7_9BACT|nr:DUF5683 domain-containing protein [Cyclobacterium amurskyense]AKP53681.1 hypothetical protein CA2015_4336 [Cyclobacterium amurskyense]|tara:strand:- start:1943 stop:2530 length:588 start_codon:yes stop_codon:yes gene_type:complete